MLEMLGVPFLILVVASPLDLSAFMGWVIHCAWISPHQRMGQTCTRNGIYLYLVSGSHVCIFVTPVIMFHHGPCHLCHNLQPEYHLLCQTHLVIFLISHQFFIETCPLWVLLQMAIFFICTCQIGMQMF